MPQPVTLKKLKLKDSMKTYKTFSNKHQKNVLFFIGDCNAKVESQEIPGVTGKFGLGIQNEAQQRLTEFCQEYSLVIGNTLFQQHKRRLYTWTLPDDQFKIRLSIFFAAKYGEAVYSQQNKTEC